MKKFFTLASLIAITFISKAQVTVSFESLSLPASNYWNGNLGVAAITPFQDNGATFLNQNDTSSFGDYWSGWGYSATIDTTSVLYSNQMSCIAGKGHNNSNIYGVAYYSFDPTINKIVFNKSSLVNGLYLNNTTLTYRSMQNGDGFAKKFGGTTGNDPDYYRIDITGWHAGTPVIDTVHFYLADFRDTNNANDYIIRDWTFVDLSSLGMLDSLTYTLASSDTSSFGINTPTYFCADDIILTPLATSDITESTSIQVYPHPAHENIMLQNLSTNEMDITIYTLTGVPMYSTHIIGNESHSINLSSFAKGTYLVQINQKSNVSYKKIILN